MNSRSARVLRGFTAALVATFAAAFSHGASGGTFPHAGLLFVGMFFGGLFCVAVTGRRVALVRVIPSVAVCQGLFHLLFSTAANDTAVTMGAGLAGAHAHHGAMTMATSPEAIQGSGSRMLFAHILAALVTVLALRFGESAFWGLLDTARLMLAIVTAWRVPVIESSEALPRVSTELLSDIDVPSAVLRGCISRRGPPAALSHL